MRLLRLRDALKVTGHGRSAFYDEIKAGRLPPGVPLIPGGSAVGWPDDELYAYTEARRRDRDHPGRRGPGRPRKSIWPRLPVPASTTEQPT